MRKEHLVCTLLMVLVFGICFARAKGENLKIEENIFQRQPTDVAILREVVSRVLDIRNPRASAMSLAQIADLIWKTDEGYARDLFLLSLNKLSVNEENQSSGPSISATNRRIVALIAKHDKNWAKALLDEDINKKPTTSFEIAVDLLETDPKLASDFAQQSLQFEIDRAFISFLKNLRQRDSDEADQLFLQVISHFPQQSNIDVNRFAILGTYLFTSPNLSPQDFQSVALTRVGNIFVPNITANLPNVQANLVQQYLRTAVFVINRPTNDLEERQVGYAFGRLLLPKAEEFYPSLVGELNDALGSLISLVPTELTSEEAYRNLRKKAYTSPEERIKEIDNIPDSYTRDRLFLDIVLQAWRRNDFSVARVATSKIEDMDIRGELEALILFGEGRRFIVDKKADLMRAMQVVDKLPNSLEKCLLWLGMASVAEKGGRLTLVSQALTSALESAIRLNDKNTPFLLLYISAQEKHISLHDSENILAEAVRAFNKIDKPEDLTMVHKVSLEPITLPFSLAVQGVNLDFKTSLQKILQRNITDGLQIIEGFNDSWLKGCGYVLFTKLILEKDTKETAVNNQEKVVRVGEDGIRKSAVKIVMPLYPRKSLKKRMKGVTVSEVQYDDGGNVTDVKVLQSPDPAAAKAVEVALKQWKFTPSKLEGEPVNIRGKITFYFLLDEKGRGKVENPQQFQ